MEYDIYEFLGNLGDVIRERFNPNDGRSFSPSHCNENSFDDQGEILGFDVINHFEY